MVDGDKSLVVADENIISVAEKNVKDIVPLYYNMRKAEPTILNSESIYNGLNSAFTGSNIGIYSNNISKIWNSEVFLSGTQKEKDEAVKIIKLLCMENNFRIDYAKTLYMPERPKWAKDLITSATKSNLPHFFIYAKDKTENQVEKRNTSLVNKLEWMIPNSRINCNYIDGNKITKRLKKPNYKLLMTNPDADRYFREVTIIKAYKDLSRKYHMKLDAMSSKYDINLCNNLTKSKIRQNLIYKDAVSMVKESLLKFGYDETVIVDILVKYLYAESSKQKDILWNCYGDILLKNLKMNIASPIKEVQCCDCGKWFTVNKYNSASIRCPECKKEVEKINAKLRKRRQREKEKNVTLP